MMGSSAKTVSAKDEDWQFAFNEFKTSSPSEVFKRLLQFYNKNKKGKHE